MKQSVVSKNGTAEIGGTLGTKETGDYVARLIERKEMKDTKDAKQTKN